MSFKTLFSYFLNSLKTNKPTNLKFQQWQKNLTARLLHYIHIYVLTA